MSIGKPSAAAGRIVVVVASFALFAGLTPATASAAPSYVALGDSYAAGPLTGMFLQPYGCLKSNLNYGHLARYRLGQPVYRDATCSGAETEDMTQPQGVTPGPNPPQFNSLDADTRVVTITIGGNDIGFSGLAGDCADFTPFNAGHPCMDKYVSGGVDVMDSRIAAVAPHVGEVLEGIHQRSPLAKVLVVNYPAIFPHTGSAGCWPTIPVADGDVPWLRSIQERLNAMLAQQAAAHGATIVDVYGASVGHDACKPPALRWVEPAVPFILGAPVHPNTVGNLAMAGLVDAAYP